MARKDYSPAEMDMTPMIDVVFQLIIFFIVTIKLDQDINKEIKLEMGKDAPDLKSEEANRGVMEIEVDKNGRLSMRNQKLRPDQLREMIHSKYKRIGEFPVVIRGDRRTRHEAIRKVMDICSEEGLYKITFAAIKRSVGEK